MNINTSFHINPSFKGEKQSEQLTPRQKQEEAEDRFIHRTKKAAKIGAVIGFIGGGFFGGLAGREVYNWITNVTKTIKPSNTKMRLAIALTGLLGGMFGQWCGKCYLAGITTIGKAIGTSFSKDANEFDARIAKQTYQEAAIGAAIGAGVNGGFNLLSGDSVTKDVGSAAFDNAVFNVGANAIRKADNLIARREAKAQAKLELAEELKSQLRGN